MAVTYNHQTRSCHNEEYKKLTLVLSELLAHKSPKARNLSDKSKGKPTGHENAAVKPPRWKLNM